MRKHRRVIGRVVGVLVVVAGLPLLAYVVFIEGMFGVRGAAGFKTEYLPAPLAMPRSAVLIDAYEDGAFDGTFYLRFRIPAEAVRELRSGKTLPGTWTHGKEPARGLPLRMRWNWRELWLVRGADCEIVDDLLTAKDEFGEDGSTPFTVIIPRPRGDQVTVYVMYTVG